MTLGIFFVSGRQLPVSKVPLTQTPDTFPVTCTSQILEIPLSVVRGEITGMLRYRRPLAQTQLFLNQVTKASD